MFKLPDKVIKDLEGYRASLADFINGKIHASRFTGIRVPWGIYSHRGGKIFMNRIRVVAGVVTPEQLKAIAQAARSWGNGIVHVTTRQDMQLHEVKIEDTIKVMDYLKGYELSPRAGGGNTLRNITTCALSGICPEEAFDVMGYAIAATEYLLGQDASYNLPRKFKITFSGCREDCSGCLVNDVGLFAVTKGLRRGFKLFAGGGMGAVSKIGRLLEEFVPEDEVGYHIAAIRNAYYKNGDRRNKHHNRLRFLIEDIGFDKFTGLYKDELKLLKETEYISLRVIDSTHPEPCGEKIPDANDRDYREFLEYNVHRQKQKGYSAVELRIPRGDITSEKLDSLAKLGNEFGSIEFRTSQNQNIWICNVKNSSTYKLFARLKTISGDFLYASTALDVVCCKGALTCNLGLCNSPGLTEEVEKTIGKNFVGKGIFKKLNIKINGCPNSCGQHPIGLIALHGMVRKVSGRPVPFYKLLLGGRFGLEETRLAKDTAILIPARNVPLFLNDFIAAIDNTLKSSDDIYRYIDEHGLELARDAASKYSHVPGYEEDRNFYVDWGKTEDFSLDGLGAGECGAGVIDMIEADLADAKIALEKAEAGRYADDKIKEALFLSARALLVVRGSDPRDAEKAFSDFIEKFVKEGIAPSRFSDLKDAYNGADNKVKFTYAKDLLDTVTKLYKNMDPSFNFPKEITAAPKEGKKSGHLYDLKGTPCPINYVKAKMFLENLNVGEVVEILVDEGEPIRNVPKSLENDGQEIIKIEKLDGFYKITVKKRV